MTARDFLKRLNSVLRYRRAIQEMNRYPDATQQDLDQENTCIICREDMRVWDLNANPGALDRIRPKKLPCGHILHLGCLKSWLERQQVCPTCRSPVTPDRANTTQNANRAPAAPQLQNNALQAGQLGFAQDQQRFGRFGIERQPLLEPAAQALLNVDAFGRPMNPQQQAPLRPNPANVRPMEEFHEMIRDEEQRRQAAEERVRRRWRRLAGPEEPSGSQPRNGSLQSQVQSPAAQHSTQSMASLASGQAALPSDTSLFSSSSSQTAPAAPTVAPQDQESQRAFPPDTLLSRQVSQRHYHAARSTRLRQLSGLYNQASIIVRQEAEALRISNEQLQVLGQLVGELERLELAAHDSTDTTTSHYPESHTLDQAPGLPSSLLGPLGNRATSVRTQSPSMMRHGATSFSSSIPAGSPDLPEGVSLPPGWSLMPLQRLENQNSNNPIGTQRSSRASSAGPATSPLGEELSAQGPTSQPSQRTNVQVLERIPGTNNFRLTGSTGNGARSEATAPTGDILTDSQPGAVLSQQQLLDRFFARGRGRDRAPGARSDASATRSATGTSSTGALTEEQSAAAALPPSSMPIWAGPSQLFAGSNRTEPTSSASVANASAASPPARANADGASSSAAAATAATSETAATEARESSKSNGKAVTLEDVSDEDDD